MTKRNLREKGFTLIELLIVIVIIGILSGVLIAVINPVRQQNRSRNATIKASLNKVSFAIQTARAGLGRLPTHADLPKELENITLRNSSQTVAPNNSCVASTITGIDCLISVSGTVLPSTCGANYFSSTGSNQCYMYIVTPANGIQGNHFRIIAKKFKLNPGDVNESDNMYVFDSSKGFYECPATVAAENFVSVPDISATNGCTVVTES